jgi:hypothetical protein
MEPTLEFVPLPRRPPLFERGSEGRCADEDEET